MQLQDKILQIVRWLDGEFIKKIGGLKYCPTIKQTNNAELEFIKSLKCKLKYYKSIYIVKYNHKSNLDILRNKFI